MILLSYFRKRRLRKDASGVPTGLLPLGSIRSMAVVVDGAGLGVGECVALVEGFCKGRGIGLRLLYADMRKFSRKSPPPTDVARTVLRRDLNWFGRPSMRKVAGLVTEPVDLYVCLYDSDAYFVRYLASSVKAKFKVGLREYGGDPYNFVVSPTRTLSEDNVPAPTDVAEVFGKIADLLGTIR